jgi:hypothetical protein
LKSGDISLYQGIVISKLMGVGKKYMIRRVNAIEKDKSLKVIIELKLNCYKMAWWPIINLKVIYDN